MTLKLVTERSVAVVTGGAGGIGSAFCRALLAGGASQIFVADLDDGRLSATVRDLQEQADEALVSPLPLDVTDPRAVHAAVDRILAQSGRIDLWFSNAGVSIGDGLGTQAEWDLSIGVNVMGHVNAARAVIPAMASMGQGHFVVTSSAAGLLSDFRSAAYSATKHAAVALAEWLAIRHAEDGVAVSCICPEGVRTGMTRESSRNAGSGMEFLEPDELAERVFAALRQGQFLVLPHPRVAEFERRRADDRERWIGGMRKARAKMRMNADAATL